MSYKIVSVLLILLALIYALFELHILGFVFFPLQKCVSSKKDRC